ncbi:OLC1v1011488C1 [Oldenlandia corymbosa var. corymbosa]|uniref:OLC1v1011488C1 n=1 Tax=Oldenlandia corymbosa var. corymbosa TaxID=529605 RepID=A0AAV1DX70_OLDCO|nr:OLC1v1011488C1 [Oldenlandia corymbosa var. corymbosa]
MYSGVRMPGARHFARIDTHELKLHIERKIGPQRSDSYFDLLTKYFSGKLNKAEFDNLCVGLVGRENLSLHNKFLQAILRNACGAKSPPVIGSKREASLNNKLPNGYNRSILHSLGKDVVPQSPRKGRTPAFRDRKVKDRPSPLGPHGKPHNIVGEESSAKVLEEQSATEILSLGSRQQSATEMLSLGSRPPVEVNSVEDGEEVEQAAGSPGTYSRIPVTAPLGISLNIKGPRKVLSHGTSSYLSAETCHFTGVLPDINALKKRLEQKLEIDGLKVTTDCINLLNNGLDAYLKRLIKPCLELASTKSEQKHPHQFQHQGLSVLNGKRPMRYAQNPSSSPLVSALDFRVAMELNPTLLGEDWPIQLEKFCLRPPE